MIDTERLTGYAREYLIAKEKYERAVRINIRSSEPLEDKSVFWGVIDDLRDRIERNRAKHCNPVHYSIHRLLRETRDLDDFPSFIRTYSKLKSKLAKKLKDFDCLGESFSDVIDSLPLAGKEACLHIIAGEAKDMESLGYIVRGTLGDLILTKENFVEQTLEQAYADVMADVLATDGEGAQQFALDLENADP